MNSIFKITAALLIGILISCNNKPKPVVEKEVSKTNISLQTNNKNEESVEGVYETQSEPGSSSDCKISVEIIKTKNGYTYFLKTKLRKLKGKATFSTNESGEKIIVLKGIEWDEYEGDISREEGNDSIAESETDSKQLEIPVGIGASYATDTLTIQNYGNAMNSYTKISECGRKYIQLIKR
ncbi:hypothetical protein [Flavobacterium aquidurense]|uniref:Lipoprotein n=1 Tax=Flavobacterium aquidurense TaxID=362413 RepID=A0A0Q0WY10_9FLAO|nr:hypothetical protein [Flavobacterium aquidurense]KQB41145.1 hypothetical protein RC62_4521 [Flavobacterium aquidurense]